MRNGLYKFLALCFLAFVFSIDSLAEAEAADKTLSNLNVMIRPSQEECRVNPPTTHMKMPVKICRTRYDVDILNTSAKDIPVVLLCGLQGAPKSFKPKTHFEALPNRKMHLPVVDIRFPDFDAKHPKKSSCVLRATGGDLHIF